MITVLNDVKNAYRADSVQKNYFIFFRDQESVLTNSEILQESLSITESICSSGNFKVGLCESAMARVDVALEPNVKGDEMTIVQTLGEFNPTIEITDSFGVQLSGDGVTQLYADSAFNASGLTIYDSNTYFQAGHYYIMTLKLDYIGDEVYLYTSASSGPTKTLYFLKEDSFGFKDVPNWSNSSQYVYGAMVKRNARLYKNIDIHNVYNTTDPASSDTWQDITKRIQIVIPIIGENFVNYKLGLWTAHTALTGSICVYEIDVPIMPLGLYAIFECKRKNDTLVRSLSGYDRMQDVQLEETIVYSGTAGSTSTIGSILDQAAADTQIRIGSNRTKEKIETALLDESVETVAITNDAIYQREHDEYMTIEGVGHEVNYVTNDFWQDNIEITGNGYVPGSVWKWLAHTGSNSWVALDSGTKYNNAELEKYWPSSEGYKRVQAVQTNTNNVNSGIYVIYKTGVPEYHDNIPAGWSSDSRRDQVGPATRYDRTADYPKSLKGINYYVVLPIGTFTYKVSCHKVHYYIFTYDVPNGWTYVSGSEKSISTSIKPYHTYTRKYKRSVVDDTWYEPSMNVKTVKYGIAGYSIGGIYNYLLEVSPPTNYGAYLNENTQVRQGVVQKAINTRGGYLTTNRQSTVRNAIVNNSTNGNVEIQTDTPYGNYGVFEVKYVENLYYEGTDSGIVAGSQPSIVVTRQLDDEVLASENVAWNNNTITATRRAVIASYLELNGLFINFDRFGVSTFLNISMSTLYPSLDLFPHTTGIYPSEGADEYIGDNETGYCKSLYVDDILNAPFDGVEIIKSNPASSEASLYPFYYNRTQKRYGVVPASMPEIGKWPGNKYYVIKSNFFIDNFIFTQNQLKAICQTIIKRIGDLQYFNLNADLKCLPYMEVGDSINIVMPKGGYETVILRRTMSGCINQMDNYETNFYNDNGGQYE